MLNEVLQIKPAMTFDILNPFNCINWGGGMSTPTGIYELNNFRGLKYFARMKILILNFSRLTEYF